MKVKTWQIAIIALGLIVGVGSVLYSVFSSNELKLPHRYHLVDVESGDIYVVDTTKYRPGIPALRPDSTVRALLPIEQEGSRWHVEGRWLGSTTGVDPGVEFKAVDKNTGELAGAPKTPVPYPTPKWD